MILSLDIETACAVAGCEEKHCEHALDRHRNHITVVGLVGDGLEEVHRDIPTLAKRLQELKGSTLVGHNILSFDLKVLKHHGIDLYDWKVEDTQLMAVACVEKIPNGYLEQYEIKRKEINKTLPHGQSHREAGRYSLKTLAPYFLGVKAFWEATGDKDNDEYVLTDARHTLNLYKKLLGMIQKDGTEKFYREKLLPWAYTLIQGEWEGVKIDLTKMAEKEAIASQKAAHAKARLDEYWMEGYEHFLDTKRRATEREYQEKSMAAIARLKYPTLKDEAKAAARHAEKIQRTRDRYAELAQIAIEKLEPFNINSSEQLSWLLKDYLGLDITNFEGEESTGIEVLERLAAEGREDIKTLIEYREQEKLVSSFFPSYRKYQVDGIIHCNFTLSRARTGRTASNRPNLQNQPPGVRDLFVARPGYKFVIRDYSGIEPVVVAFVTKDPILCDLIIRGGNFHSFNTPSFFPYVECSEAEVKKLFPAERDAAKELGLMLIYGGGWRRIKISMMKRGFKLSDSECKARYENFKELYRQVFEFKQDYLDPMLNAGGEVTNLLGRKFKLEPDEVHMKGINTLVQSSASDMLLQSATKIRRRFEEMGIRGIPLLFVHDEVVVEVEEARLREAEQIIDEIMTSYKLPTPYGQLPVKVEGHTAAFWAK